MKQEDKDLLLKDLCARLPYNCKVFYEYVDDSGSKTYRYSLTLNTWCIAEFRANKAIVKPFLRPMSSMTEEECDMVEEILGDKCIFDFMSNGDIILKQGQFSQNKLAKLYDYYNLIHVDYRDLIPNGLAIAVTEENNPYKE